jgi:hypothetical protein
MANFPARPTGGDQLTAELSPQEETTLLHIADGGSGEHDIEEAAVSRLQTLELVEQRGVSLGLTLRGVQKVARLRPRFARILTSSPRRP